MIEHRVSDHTRMGEGLLPCPFCGGKAAMHGAIYMSRKFPACTQCGAERASVEQWNQRVSTLPCDHVFDLDRCIKCGGVA